MNTKHHTSPITATPEEILHEIAMLNERCNEAARAGRFTKAGKLADRIAELKSYL